MPSCFWRRVWVVKGQFATVAPKRFTEDVKLDEEVDVHLSHNSLLVVRQNIPIVSLQTAYNYNMSLLMQNVFAENTNRNM